MERGELLERFNQYVSSKEAEGYTIVEKNDDILVCVVHKEAEKVSHLLHLTLTIITILWAFVWFFFFATAKKEVRIRATIDSFGNLVEEQIASNA